MWLFNWIVRITQNNGQIRKSNESNKKYKRIAYLLYASVIWATQYWEFFTAPAICTILQYVIINLSLSETRLGDKLYIDSFHVPTLNDFFELVNG